MCEVTPKRCEFACTGACHSVVDYTKYDSSCVAKPMKKETETTLFTTEATQQKQHTTHNYSIYSSVVISVHICLQWCSHRHLASVFAPCIHLLPFRPIAVCIGVRTVHPSLNFCFVHVEFDIARLLLLWSVLLLHHAGSRSHPGWGEGIYGRTGYSKAGIVCEGSFRHLEELLTASSCTNSEYQG